MVAILLIGSGFAGLIGAAVAWGLGGGLLMIIFTYAVAGNLVFSVLSALLAVQHPREQGRDFSAEVEADLLALLEERYERLRQTEEGPVRWCPVLRRPSQRQKDIPPRERRLFRAG